MVHPLMKNVSKLDTRAIISRGGNDEEDYKRGLETLANIVITPHITGLISYIKALLPGKGVPENIVLRRLIRKKFVKDEQEGKEFLDELVNTALYSSRGSAPTYIRNHALYLTRHEIAAYKTQSLRYSVVLKKFEDDSGSKFYTINAE